MKKLFLVFPIILLIFCGCTKATEEFEPSRNFESKITIKQNSTAYSADFAMNKSGCYAVFLLPTGQKYKIEYSNNAFTYSLDGIEFVSPASEKQMSFLPLIYESFISPNNTVIENETCYTVTGSNEQGIYCFNIDKANLKPTYFEIEAIGLTVNFES